MRSLKEPNIYGFKTFFFLNIKRKIILGESVKTGALEEKMGELSNQFELSALHTRYVKNIWFYEKHINVSQWR